MSKQKIKLFFEDTVKSNMDAHKKFARAITSKLTKDYEISKDYGKIGLIKGEIYFSPTHKGIKDSNYIVPERLKSTNAESLWDLKKLTGEYIPFFVIDTDGINIDNIFPFFDHQMYVWGRPPLLSKIFRIKHNLKIRWGLILINPNREGTEYKSLRIVNDDDEKILFKNKKEQAIKLSWLYQGNQKSKCFYNIEDPVFGYDKKTPKFETPRVQFDLVKKIWAMPEVKEKFKNGISSDITSLHHQIIKLISEENLNNKRIRKKFTRRGKNKQLYEMNAEKTKFSLYLAKNKKEENQDGVTYKDFSGEIKKYLKPVSSKSGENINIEYRKFNFLD